MITTSIDVLSMKKGLSILFLSVLFFTVPAGAESPSAVQQILTASFAQKDQSSVIASLKSAAGKQTVPADKKRILAALADYEERLGLHDEASRHYNEASLSDPVARDDALLLDAARCALASNDTARADGLVRAVLLTNFDDKILFRARTYAAWILLASGDRSGALPLLRAYAQNPAFAEFAPSLLFTLWWSDNDQDARSRLLSSFPKSPEAAIIRGEMALSPSPFWFLMGRNEGLVAAFAKAGTGSVTVAPPAQKTETLPVAPTGTVKEPERQEGKAWQQVGFFKNSEYADELVIQLKKRGFAPIVRKETRPSGTVYLSVLVPEDGERSTGPKLKDAGFESFLILE